MINRATIAKLMTAILTVCFAVSCGPMEGEDDMVERYIAYPPLKGDVVLVLGQSNCYELDKYWDHDQLGMAIFAEAGSSIYKWAPDQVNYKTAISLVDPERVKAVVWFQGESDAAGELPAMLYKTRLDVLIDFLDYTENSQVILIQTETGRKFDWMIRNAKDEAEAEWEYAHTLESSDLPRKSDGIHLTPDGKRQLCGRIAVVVDGL